MKQPTKPYPLTTQLILELYESGALTNVAALHIEPTYGFYGHITYTDGSTRIFRLMNLGVNDHGAAQLARDKAYTKHFLQHFGYIVPAGQTFVTAHFFRAYPTTFLEDIGEVKTIAAIQAYIASETGYPCFIKPNDSSQGRGVYQCHTPDEVAQAVDALYHDVFDTILVEAAVTYPEYRLVVYKDQMICAYQKKPLSIVGDGKKSVRQQIDTLQAQFIAANRPLKLHWDDPQIAQLLAKQGVSHDSIPQAGQEIFLTDTANLSRGGIVHDVTETLHPHWRDFAIAVVQQFGLTFCGIDVCCADITQPDSDYAILELNGSPSMAHYARSSAAANTKTRQFIKCVVNNEC